jgi:hypothetical protein
MKTENFTKLIQLITKRNFVFTTSHEELQFETEYNIQRTLPITGRVIRFTWKTPKAEDKMLRSFITAFTSKYREPNPKAYKNCAPYFSPSWEEMTEEKREQCYYHHFSNMLSKEELLKQVEQNFASEGVKEGLLKYGFYNTEYGIGIFCFWMTDGVNAAIKAMAEHLHKLSIPYSNEFSDARWVYRFKLGLTKENHLSIIQKLS